jgi:hypothetical protein
LFGKQTAKTAPRGSLVSFGNQFQFVENKLKKPVMVSNWFKTGFMQQMVKAV